jgi:hypothetical protein
MSPSEVPAFGRFQLLQLVRHDGVTTLHEAFDAELGQPVALITSPAGADAAENERLAFRLPRMRHPNIVSVLAAGRQGDVAFVAAEWLQTEPLSAFLARAGRIPVFQGLALVLQLLSAIEHAHARRVVHATIDVDHVQVMRTGQLKLPPDGWSLSADRQPNLEAAARIAQVLLSGVCNPHRRRLLDEVLLRAQGQDPDARYQRADEFAHALMAAAGLPVGSRPCAIEHPAPAQLEPPSPVPVARPDPQPAPARAPRKSVHRRRLVSVLGAASFVAAMLVPSLISNSNFTAKQDTPVSTVTLPLEAPPAPPSPQRVSLAPSAAPAVEPPPPAVEPPPAAKEPRPTAPDTHDSNAVPSRSVASQPAKRAAVPQPTTAARPAPSARQVQTSMSRAAPARAARPKAAPALTAASGCRYDWRIARDFCEAQQCRRTDLRKTPMCMRILAQQRATLARLRGTPD